MSSDIDCCSNPCKRCGFPPHDHSRSRWKRDFVYSSSQLLLPLLDRLLRAEPYCYLRSEKSGVSSWSLLGIRGLEAVQVSSHRGPPTDRPPDIPPGKVGVFAGCLLERAGTPSVSQLASFSRRLIARAAMPSLCRKCKLGGVRHRTIPRLMQLVPLRNQVPKAGDGCLAVSLDPLT
jgi:hypothetical protein